MEASDKGFPDLMEEALRKYAPPDAVIKRIRLEDGGEATHISYVSCPCPQCSEVHDPEGAAEGGQA